MPTTAAGEEVRDELDVTGMINGKKVFACSVRSLRAHKKSLIYLGFFFFFQQAGRFWANQEYDESVRLWDAANYSLISPVCNARVYRENVITFGEGSIGA